MGFNPFEQVVGLYENLKKTLDKFEDLSVIIGGVTTLLIALLVTANVVSRAFLNRPFPIRFIVEEYLMVAVVFLPMSVLQRYEGNVKVEIVEDRFSLRLKEYLKLSHRILILFVFLALCLWYFQESLATFESGVQSVGELSLPLFPTWWIATIGIIALTVRVLIQVIGQILEIWEGDFDGN